MPKSLLDHRIGVYECQKDSSGAVTKGKPVNSYYAYYRREQLDRLVIPDLERLRDKFSFPVLVTSWRLEEGVPSELISRPTGKLSITSAGGLRNAKKALGIPIRRRKASKTEKWEVLIDERGNIFDLDGFRIVNRNA
jgi:hypothetical protein